MDRATGADPLSRLIYEFSKLPGIGEKTAARLTYHVLKQDSQYAQSLATALIEARTKTHLCGRCFQFTESDLCRICKDSGRSATQICVVERPSDVLPIEQTGSFRGVYHVLHGILSPLEGIGPEKLKIRELLARLPHTEEVILALNPSVEGDATALYLHKLLQPSGIKVTQLAHGLPVGGALEYTDRQTLGKALSNRVELGNK